MGIYIKGIGAISPQVRYSNAIFENSTNYTGNRLKCIEPDYSQFFDAKQIRRMSRIIKMGVAASMISLKDAEIEKPDSVIVGTALGCLEDTGEFLKKMVQNKEDMLSPTAFIHSTHNTIAAQIALLYQCFGYNSTYVHRNISFESALIDAIMLLNEGVAKNVIAGGIDELTEISFTILNRLGNYKKIDELNSGNLYASRTKGAIAGEGATFFALANELDSKCYAEIKNIQTFSFSSCEEILPNIQTILSESKADIILTGHTGDFDEDKEYDWVVNELNIKDKNIKYKHLCGEYSTSSAFALYLAAIILKKRVSPYGILDEISTKEIKNILIYNKNKNVHHSLMLISAC